MKAKIFFLSYARHGLWLGWLIVVMKSCKKIWKKKKILEAKKLVLFIQQSQHASKSDDDVFLHCMGIDNIWHGNV